MKKLAILAVLAAGSLPLAAQNSTVEEKVKYSSDKQTEETSRFRNNWFVSAGGGGLIYFGDHDKQADFGDRIAPALDIAVGKWFTKGIGVRLMYSGLQQRGATKHPGDKYEDSAHGTGAPVQGGGAPHWLEKQKFNISNIHADVMFNLVQLIGKRESNWSASPYMGIGWVHVGESPKANGVSGNFGLLTSYNLNSRLDLNLDVRGVLMKDGMDGEKGGRGEGMMTVTLGVSYFF